MLPARVCGLRTGTARQSHREDLGFGCLSCYLCAYECFLQSPVRTLIPPKESCRRVFGFRGQAAVRASDVDRTRGPIFFCAQASSPEIG